MSLAPSMSAPRSRFNTLPLVIGVFCLLWSYAFVAGKIGVTHCPPLILLAARFSLAGILIVSATLIRGSDDIHQLVLRRQHHVRRAKKCIGASGKDANAFVTVRDLRLEIGDFKINLRTFAPPDPVALHLLDRGRPINQCQVIKHLARCVPSAWSFPTVALFTGHPPASLASAAPGSATQTGRTRARAR